MLKDKTREIAKELDLNVADKPDSQDICFVQMVLINVSRYTDYIPTHFQRRGMVLRGLETKDALC